MLLLFILISIGLCLDEKLEVLHYEIRDFLPADFDYDTIFEEFVPLNERISLIQQLVRVGIQQQFDDLVFDVVECIPELFLDGEAELMEFFVLIMASEGMALEEDGMASSNFEIYIETLFAIANSLVTRVMPEGNTMNNIHQLFFAPFSKLSFNYKTTEPFLALLRLPSAFSAMRMRPDFHRALVCMCINTYVSVIKLCYPSLSGTVDTSYALRKFSFLQAVQVTSALSQEKLDFILENRMKFLDRVAYSELEEYLAKKFVVPEDTDSGSIRIPSLILALFIL